MCGWLCILKNKAPTKGFFFKFILYFQLILGWNIPFKRGNAVKCVQLSLNKSTHVTQMPLELLTFALKSDHLKRQHELRVTSSGKSTAPPSTSEIYHRCYLKEKFEISWIFLDSTSISAQPKQSQEPGDFCLLKHKCCKHKLYIKDVHSFHHPTQKCLKLAFFLTASRGTIHLVPKRSTIKHFPDEFMVLEHEEHNVYWANYGHTENQKQHIRSAPH